MITFYNSAITCLMVIPEEIIDLSRWTQWLFSIACLELTQLVFGQLDSQLLFKKLSDGCHCSRLILNICCYSFKGDLTNFFFCLVLQALQLCTPKARINWMWGTIPVWVPNATWLQKSWTKLSRQTALTHTKGSISGLLGWSFGK